MTHSGDLRCRVSYCLIYPSLSVAGKKICRKNRKNLQRNKTKSSQAYRSPIYRRAIVSKLKKIGLSAKPVFFYLLFWRNKKAITPGIIHPLFLETARPEGNYVFTFPNNAKNFPVDIFIICSIHRCSRTERFSWKLI